MLKISLIAFQKKKKKRKEKKKTLFKSPKYSIINSGCPLKSKEKKDIYHFLKKKKKKKKYLIVMIGKYY